MSFYSSQSDYQTVQGDKQTIDEQLELPDGTNPDLAGRSVEFVMRHMPSGAKVVSAAATIDDAAAGSVSYTLAPDETGRAGLHHAEWILTGGADDPTTLPVDEPVNIYIREDVEGDGPVAETLPDDIDGETITPAQVGTPDNPFAGYAGELSVNGGQPVTAVAGTAGDYILRKTISLPISYSTTSTTYNTYFGNGYLVNEESLTTTNANDIYISTTAKTKNDTAGETTTFSIKSQGNTYGEISGTATSSNNTTLKFSGISDYTRAGVENAQLYPQIKVTGGSGDVQSASIGFWVKVGTQ